jgi:hypothetical protein
VVRYWNVFCVGDSSEHFIFIESRRQLLYCEHGSLVEEVWLLQPAFYLTCRIKRTLKKTHCTVPSLIFTLPEITGLCFKN